MYLLRAISIATVFVLAFTAPGALSNSVLNGVAIHSELGKDQFVAGLFTDTPSADARAVLLSETQKRIEVRVLPERLSSRRFKRMWIEGMAINASSEQLTEQAQHMADFSNMLKIKLVAGDIFAVERKSDIVEISLNGAKLGMIPDPTFFDLLLRTWIGPVPLSSTFRDNILSNGNIDNNLRATFNNTKPTPTRIAAVEAAASSLRDSSEAVAAISNQVASIPKPKITTKIKIEAPVIEKPVISAKPKPSEPAKPKPKKPVEIAAVDPTPAKSPSAPTLLTDEPQLEDLSDITLPAAPVKTAPKKPQTVDVSALVDDEEGLEEELPFTAQSLLNQTLYIAKLKKWSHEYLRYPTRAASRGQEGSVRMNVTIDRSGRVKDITVIEESEFSSLTKEATRAVKRADPFPPVPEGVGGETFVFTLPVVFKLRNSR